MTLKDEILNEMDSFERKNYRLNKQGGFSEARAIITACRLSGFTEGRVAERRENTNTIIGTGPRTPRKNPFAAFKEIFLQESGTGQPNKNGREELKKSFKSAFQARGKSPEVAERMAETAIRGR